MDFKETINGANVNRRSMMLACVGIGIIGLTSCQTDTKNQKPLSPIDYDFDAPKQKVKEQIIRTFGEHGYVLNKDSEFQLVLDKPASEFSAKLIFGSELNGTPSYRVTLTITGENPTHVSTQIAIITNPGTGLEIPHNFTNDRNARDVISKHLEQVKNSLIQK